MALLASSAVYAAEPWRQLPNVGSDTRSPPMESVNTETGHIVGFDVDVVNGICAKVNCKAEFVTTGWDGIFAALDQGSFDLVVSGVSITDDRKKAMYFSEPQIVNSQAILMRVEDEGQTTHHFKISAGSSPRRPTRPMRSSLRASSARTTSLPMTFCRLLIALKNKDVEGVVINGANAASSSTGADDLARPCKNRCPTASILFSPNLPSTGGSPSAHPADLRTRPSHAPPALRR